jgi:hypothetical protein
MIIAMMTMLVMIGLTLAVSSATVDVNSAATRTSAAARATAAAQAGEQVAIFRLDTTGGSTGATGALGNSATYSYTVSTLASSSNPCTGLWVQNSSQTVEQDCVTSVGTVGGVSERLQARVAGYAPTTSLFPVNGLFAIDGFSAANNVAGNFNLASNGQMTFNNTITLTGQIEYQSGKISYTNNACSGNCSLSQQSTAIGLPAEPQSAYAAAQTSNNDAAITWGSQFNTSTSAYTVTSNGSNNATINIPAGTYYYCDLNLGNNTTLNTTSWPVKIYVDSNYDTSGPCTSASGGNGQMSGSNGFAVANTSGTASNVQVFFYGQPGCTTSCPNDFSPNGTSMTADVYAPYSSSTPGNAFTMTGALVIGSLTANNVLTFNWQTPSSSGSSATSAAYYPTALQTCVPASTSSMC